MPPIPRRLFLLGGGALPALAAAKVAGIRSPDEASVTDRTVQLRTDGLALPTRDHARLLAHLAENPGIEADVYTRDGVVKQLEECMAALLGKEMAVFLPTGTLANHLALRNLARKGRRVLVQADSHLYTETGDCVQRLSDLTLIPLAAGRATFVLDEVREQVQEALHGGVAAPVGAISIESPVKAALGEVFDFNEMQRITAFAREQQIGLHLDGARLFLASAYTGISPASYAAPFDTVYVSLYKYFNATAGAILAGPRSLLENLYHERRMFGGSLRCAWPQAAVALHYLEGFADRFGQAVARADELHRALDRHPRCRIERRPAGTNIVVLHVEGTDAAALPEKLRSHGIGVRSAHRVDAQAAQFLLYTNESLLRRPVAQIVEQFNAALV